MGKVSRAELERRLRALRRALSRGEQFEDLVAAARQDWGVRPQTVMRYVRKVFEEWRKRPGTRGDHRRLGIEQRDELYRRGLAKDRLRDALASLDSRDRLRGLFDRKRKEGVGPASLADFIRASLEESGPLESAGASEASASGGWGSGHEQAWDEA